MRYALQLLKQFTFPRRRSSATAHPFERSQTLAEELDLFVPQAMGDFAGRWSLIGNAAVAAEVAFIDGRLHPDGVNDWLNEVETGLEEHIKANSGVDIEIATDGRYIERVLGQGQLRCFNAEGVLTDAAPCVGKVVTTEQAGYLRPDEVPKWDLPKPGKYGKAVLRLDDGDIQIADCIRIQGIYLIRTTNVVTDGLRLDRTVFVYKKQPPAL
jgi:hypothetical protein